MNVYASPLQIDCQQDVSFGAFFAALEGHAD